MSNTFQNVPVEKGTRIHVEKEIRVGEMDTLYHVWRRREFVDGRLLLVTLGI